MDSLLSVTTTRGMAAVETYHLCSSWVRGNHGRRPHLHREGHLESGSKTSTPLSCTEAPRTLAQVQVARFSAFAAIQAPLVTSKERAAVREATAVCVVRVKLFPDPVLRTHRNRWPPPQESRQPTNQPTAAAAAATPARCVWSVPPAATMPLQCCPTVATSPIVRPKPFLDTCHHPCVGALSTCPQLRGHYTGRRHLALGQADKEVAQCPRSSHKRPPRCSAPPACVCARAAATAADDEGHTLALLRRGGKAAHHAGAARELRGPVRARNYKHVGGYK